MTSAPQTHDRPTPPYPGSAAFGAVGADERPRPVGGAGAVIAAVRADGPADRTGIRSGDRLIAIDGIVPRDLTDVRVQVQDRVTVMVDLERAGRPISRRVGLDGELDLGVDFEQPTFDGLRQCNNNCEFCFIRGLPRGLRRSLYVRDDDYRYSFLFGSFVTLTNLAEEDWHRIAYQRLTPLRVSIHATDPALRARLLAHPGAAPIVPQLRWLGRAGIQVHAQIVLCPGLNDREVLEQTARDLAELDQVVASIAVVPVGISDHLRVREIRSVTPDDAREALDRLASLRRTFRRRLGRSLIFPSDELFLLAGRDLPGSAFYEDFPQIQNGVGLTRVMLADWRRTRRRLPAGVSPPRRVAWLCGRAAAPALRLMAAGAGAVVGLTIDVRVVENTLFGSSITVSGLMSGRDVVRVLASDRPDLAVLPRSAFGFEGERTLDDWSVEQIERETGVAVRLGRTAGELVALSTAEEPLIGMAARQERHGPEPPTRVASIRRSAAGR
jgi:putative radical SAM enzyme (TIGR03279 family)